jgi:uncharacterized protein
MPPTSNAPEAPPSCVGCGVCCFSALADYVQVTGDDYERLGDLVTDYVHFTGNKAYLTMQDGHCSALGIGTADADGRSGAGFPCRIYLHRPQICRDLAYASSECAGEIATKGERPAQALIQLGAQRRLSHL